MVLFITVISYIALDVFQSSFFLCIGLVVSISRILELEGINSYAQQYG